jgi:hypothetical protein
LSSEWGEASTTASSPPPFKRLAGKGRHTAKSAIASEKTGSPDDGGRPMTQWNSRFSSSRDPMTKQKEALYLYSD